MMRGAENKIYEARLTEQSGVVLDIEKKAEKGDTRPELFSLLTVKRPSSIQVQQDLVGHYKQLSRDQYSSALEPPSLEALINCSETRQK